MYTGYQTNGFLNEFLKATHPTTHQRLRQSTLAVLLIEEGIKLKEEEEEWRRFSRSSEIVNKQAKIMSASLKRMSDMGAKNGEGMLEVLADDMIMIWVDMDF